MSNMIGPALPPPITDNTNIRKTDPSSPWAISDALTAQDIARNKRFKGAIQSTPWLDHWEFEDVGRSLATGARSCILVGTTKNKKTRTRKRRRHSDDADYQQRPEAIPTSSTEPRAMMEEPLASLYRALDRMSVWKIRMDTRIPHAVESSYQLAQVHARSNTNINNKGNNHRSYGGTEELRLAYGCAILRSINGLADALQQTRAHAASIAVLCGDLGIPSWLVDVRHAATHNQLPTLSVLKLAATTLLEYLQQQYWEPRSFLTSSNNGGDANSSRGERNSVMTDLVQHLLAYKEQQEIALAKADTEAERKAAERKGKTDNSSNKSKSKKKTPPPKKPLLSYDSSDSDEEVYLDGLVSSSWNPALSSSKTMGTSINRFAVLFEEDIKKKKKKQKTKPDVKATAEEKAEQKKTKEASPHHHARQFIKTAMQSNQFDVAYQAALLFLVWGGVGGMEQGALLPPPVASADELYPETAAGIQRMQQMYGILLVVLGHEWSGFLHALMIHLVDSIVTLEQTQSQPHEEEAAETIKEKSRRLFFLESWVRYLLSRDFVANFHNGLNKKKSSKTNINSKAKTINQEMAPWSFLEQMWYPLNSLCDRLELSCSSSSSRATSQRLVDLFCEVLGEYRVSQFGVVFDDEDDGESVLSRENRAEDALDGMEEDGIPPSSTSSHNEETLDDTAKPEAPENTAKDKSGSLPRKRRAWVKCTSWEPCTIGALPGHPCCS